MKSTRVVTKFKWRTPEQANGGPQIVASQTVYEYLVAGAASDDDFIAARGRPAEVGDPIVSPWFRGPTRNARVERVETMRRSFILYSY